MEELIPKPKKRKKLRKPGGESGTSAGRNTSAGGKTGKSRVKSDVPESPIEPQPTDFPPVVALDVGTTKIACLIGELDADGNLGRLVGSGHSPAKGMHKGVVVDLEDAAQSIRDSVSEAEADAGYRVREAFVGVAGAHVISMNRKVSLTNPNEDGRVTKAEREALLEKLKKVEVSSDLQLIHALPREYTLDGQDGIRRPVGMWSKKIEMSGHLVFGAINSIQNLVEAVGQAGLSTADIVLEPLASSEACLDDQDLNSGVILVDIGGGTTDVAMFVHGRLVHTAVLPVGGNHITRDISVGLKVPLAAAEDIKLKHGHAESHLVEDIEMLKVPIAVAGAAEDRTVTFSKKFLSRVIEARVAEIFSLVMRQARDSGYLSSVAAGMVVTGGSSQLEGICGLATNVTKLPARLGVPTVGSGAVDIPGNPVYATAVGLLLYGSRRIFLRGPSQPPEPSITTVGLWNEVLAKVKGWFGQTGKA
ncbi:MAG: cell division protein FtsA [Thermoleophilia bacterium]|nr:cell division protein FtsA [Thermoleophilia bacterium]